LVMEQDFASWENPAPLPMDNKEIEKEDDD